MGKYIKILVRARIPDLLGAYTCLHLYMPIGAKNNFKSRPLTALVYTAFRMGSWPSPSHQLMGWPVCSQHGNTGELPHGF